MSKYRKPSVTVDILIVRIKEYTLQGLFILRRNPPFKMTLAIPGGFIDAHESLDSAAFRELREETSLGDNIYLEQIYSFGKPKRDPRERIITILYAAFISETASKTIPGSDALDTKWIPIDNTLPTLAFDHKELTEFVLKRTKSFCLYKPILFQTMQNFTEIEILKLYESILKQKLLKETLTKTLLDNEVIIKERNIYNFNLNKISFLNNRIFTL